MDKEKQLGISAGLINATGINNALIPIIVGIAAGSKTEEECRTKLMGVRGLNPALIPNVMAIIVQSAPLKSAPPAETSEKETPAPAAAKTSPASEEELIYEAVSKIMSEGKKENLTSSGVPKVEVLEEMLGFGITAGQRNDAVDAWQEENS